jgi:hypothetical protein
MTTSTFVLIASMAGLATAQAPAAAPAVPAQPPYALEIGLRITRADDVVATAAAGPGASVSGSVWADLTACSAGAGDREPGVDRVRWRVAGRILQRAGDAFVVEAEWQRIGDGAGRAVDGPKSIQQITIRLGEHVMLDQMAPTLGGPCPKRTVRLEAAIVLPDLSRTKPAAGGGGGSGRGGAGAGSGGAGGSAATARELRAHAEALMGAISGSGSMTAAEMARSMARVTRGVISGIPAGSGAVAAGDGPPVEMRPVSSASYDVETWLVHVPPGGVEETQRMAIHISAGGDTLSFAPIVVPTSAGPANVDIATMVRPVETVDGRLVLHVVVARRVSGSAKTLGSSAKFIPMPGPSDIVSFEMPQLPRVGVDPTVGHQFSVRIRVAPGKSD